MSQQTIQLKEGEHVAIFGQNGSGKSLCGMNALHYSEIFPIVIYDTKLDNDFYTIIPEGFTDVTVYNLETFKHLLKMDRRHMPDYIIVRPPPEELDNPKQLDQYLLSHYYGLPDSVCYIDEAYHFHSNTGVCFAGLKALLTRGRSSKITCVICSQRPFYISTFVKSEVKHFYVYFLTVQKDLKEVIDIARFMAQDLLGENKKTELEQYHYWYYDVIKRTGAIYKPVHDVRQRGI